MKKFGDRRDGTLIRDLDSMHFIMPIIYPNRADNEAYISETIDLTAQYAKTMGMEPYYLYRQKNMAGNFENVGYAKPGKAGIYNILIMEEKQSIMALGAGASTKYVFDHGKRIERVENVKDIKNYLERIDEMIERKRESFALYMK